MRALLPMLVLAACSSAPPATQPYGADLPALEANGLPADYTRCVRSAAMKTADFYDVYYPCHPELISYLARMGGKTQQEKAVLADGMEKKALDYAQEQVEAFHGPDAVRRASAPTLPAAKPSVAPPETRERMKLWAACAVKTIGTAHSQGWDTDAIIGLARSSCGHLWTGTPEGADRLYAKILASVRAGTDPGYTVSPSTPAAPDEIRM